MSGIVIDLDPMLLRLGSLQVEWHGFLTAVAVIVGVFLAVHAGRSRGIPSNTIYNIPASGPRHLGSPGWWRRGGADLRAS